MSIRGNKARADLLVEEVLAERRARRAHSAQAKAIFLRRLGSPAGLAVCFGAGAVAGLRLGEGGLSEPADTRHPDDHGQKGFLDGFLDSPLGNVAVRLAAATVVRYAFTHGGGGDGGEAAAGPAEDMAAPGATEAG